MPGVASPKRGRSSTPSMKKASAKKSSSPTKDKNNANVDSPAASRTLRLKTILSRKVTSLKNTVGSSMIEARESSLYLMYMPYLVFCFTIRIAMQVLQGKWTPEESADSMASILSVAGVQGTPEGADMWAQFYGLCTDQQTLFYVFSCVMISINTILRLDYPSSYVPVTRCKDSFLASPILARVVATVAEVCFCMLEADTLGLAFFSADAYGQLHIGAIGALTVLGELLCWSHLIFQCEVLGWLEDATWTVLQAAALVLASLYTEHLHFGLVVAFILPYLLHMWINALPRQLSRAIASVKEGRTWSLYPFRNVKIASPDVGTTQWMTELLLATPLVFGAMLCLPPPRVSDVMAGLNDSPGIDQEIMLAGVAFYSGIMLYSAGIAYLLRPIVVKTA
ncbi:unnamed protein product [Amoebophrya sp. A25]|nr:unnamed protein product [Amoebophrya sp. A25]|eukprot:GSA25T00001724001.1